MVTDNQWEKRRETAERVHQEYQQKYRQLDRVKQRRSKYRQLDRVKQRRNELQRKTYRENPRLRRQSIVSALAGAAIKAGRLVRGKCEVCGKEPTEAHHDDYSKPYDVRWLCKKCHAAHHRQMRRKKKPLVKEAAHQTEAEAEVEYILQYLAPGRAIWNGAIEAAVQVVMRRVDESVARMVAEEIRRLKKG